MDIKKIPDFSMHDPFITIDDEWIKITALAIIAKFNRTEKEYMEDMISRHHQGRRICVIAHDGENLKNLGFLDFLKDLCDRLDIDNSRVAISSFDSVKEYGWTSFVPYYNILFWAQNIMGSDVTVQDNAKLFGIAVGRFSPGRLRTLYEIDQIFADDTYMVCNFSPGELSWFEEKIHRRSSIEVQWARDKKFDQDPTLPDEMKNSGGLGWQHAYQYYHDLAANYHIEIISETDHHSPRWFTEKTGKCLVTGKPFLLAGGTGSLQNLRDMGFHTFGSVIDESYDQEPTLNQRLEKMLHVMESIRSSPDREHILTSMRQIAQYNRSNFQEIDLAYLRHINYF